MWVLILISTYYAAAPASVDFFSKEACELAQKQTKEQSTRVVAFCTPKGDTKSYNGWQTQTEKELCGKLRAVGQECF